MNYSLRKSKAFKRQEAYEAALGAGIIPSIIESIESMKQTESMLCAAFEAGTLFKGGAEIGDILDAIEEKYNIPDIRETIYRMLEKYSTDPHGFGVTADYVNALMDLHKNGIGEAMEPSV